MSQFSEHIKATRTNGRKLLSDIMHVTESFENVYKFPEVVVYKIGAAISVEVLIDDEADSEGKTVMVEIAKRKLVEHMFGEFRLPLLDLDLAIANGENRKAREQLKKIFDTMFDV